MFVNQALPKPADVLIHYNYGAAVVKHWGQNTYILNNCSDIPRPSIPAPAPLGPPRFKSNLKYAIQERAVATHQEECVAGNDTEARESWDEDDVVLFCWGNSRVAQARAARVEEERNKNLEEWRSGVATGI